jgi:predicted flap endonuclease-1-like 5' DNA nuclease
MDINIIDIEGIGAKYAEKLEAIGISTIGQLLEKGAGQKGRKELEKESGIDGKHLLKWIGMADLYRIDGVGKQFAELLKAAGVDTVKELRTRKAENLQATLEITNQEKKLTKAVPSFVQVRLWIEHAKELEATLTY